MNLIYHGYTVQTSCYNRLESLNIQSELHAPEGMDHEYWGKPMLEIG